MNIWSYILIFFIGLVIGIIIGYKISNIFCKKYNRNCTNCKYSTFAESKDGVIRIYCQRAIDVAGSVLPIKDYEVCGHFDYTDEIKTEQVKEKAEKMVKFTKEYDGKLTTKIENEFYNIFGLYKYAYLLKDTYYINKTAFKDKEFLVRLFKSYKNNRRFVVKKVEKQYFNITGKQWLKLICLHTEYTDLSFTSNTVKDLKNEIMKDLLEVYEDIYVQNELYADIRKVFNLKS